jgi:hypothetical protein
MDKSRETHDLNKVCGDEEPELKSGSGSLQDFQAAEMHVSSPLGKSLPQLDARQRVYGKDRIHQMTAGAVHQIHRKIASYKSYPRTLLGKMSLFHLFHNQQSLFKIALWSCQRRPIPLILDP